MSSRRSVEGTGRRKAGNQKPESLINDGVGPACSVVTAVVSLDRGPREKAQAGGREGLPKGPAQPWKDPWEVSL